MYLETASSRGSRSSPRKETRDASNAIWHSWYQSALGRPLTDRQPVADGQAVYFEFGCTFQGPSTNNEVIACQLIAPRMGTPHLMRGKVSELLDFNIAKERSADLLRMCAGMGEARPVDLVLCGHAHFNVECRFQWSSNDDCSFFFDYYTCNPGVYYKTSLLAVQSSS